MGPQRALGHALAAALGHPPLAALAADAARRADASILELVPPPPRPKKGPITEAMSEDDEAGGARTRAVDGGFCWARLPSLGLLEENMVGLEDAKQRLRNLCDLVQLDRFSPRH